MCQTLFSVLDIERDDLDSVLVLMDAILMRKTSTNKITIQSDEWHWRSVNGRALLSLLLLFLMYSVHVFNLKDKSLDGLEDKKRWDQIANGWFFFPSVILWRIVTRSMKTKVCSLSYKCKLILCLGLKERRFRCSFLSHALEQVFIINKRSYIVFYWRHEY